MTGWNLNNIKQQTNGYIIIVNICAISNIIYDSKSRIIFHYIGYQI